MATLDQVIRCLENSKIQYRSFALANGYRVIVPSWSGRILGPFDERTGRSLLWMSTAWQDSGTFTEAVQSNLWNLGGDRVWLAPEIAFNVRDRDDLIGTYGVQSALDPATWHLDGSNATAVARLETELETYNCASQSKSVCIQRTIRPAANPLRTLPGAGEVAAKVRFTGYSQQVMYEDRSPDSLMTEVWNIVQLPAGGELVIPSTPGFEYLDFFENGVAQDHVSYREGSIRVRLTGDSFFKIGLFCPTLFGRLAYLIDHGDSVELYCRLFFNNPSTEYVEQPARIKDTCAGLSVSVYNDSGDQGHFGELECNGQTVGGETGRTQSVDEFVFWHFAGSADDVRGVMDLLIG